MHIINVDHITVNYTGREIFRDLSWAIGDRDRNRSGRAKWRGQVQPAQNHCRGVSNPMLGSWHSASVRVGYLPQEVKLSPGRTSLTKP